MADDGTGGPPKNFIIRTLNLLQVVC